MKGEVCARQTPDYATGLPCRSVVDMEKIDGFILKGEAPSNVIASEELDHLEFVAIVLSHANAIDLVRNLGFTNVKVIDSGEHVLKRAKGIGLSENTVRPINSIPPFTPR
jgi:hypothetical protein